MQIIIEQAEIETAIRNHINSLISLKEGSRIDVDLAATRGKGGFTATIDIVPESAEPSKKAEVVSEDEPEAAEPEPVKKALPKGKVVFSKPTPAQAPVEEEQATETEPEETPKEQAEEPASVDATSSEEEETPAPATRSLFGALKKPVNS